nr:DMT family transporter [Mangrovicella endophytica]
MPRTLPATGRNAVFLGVVLMLVGDLAFSLNDAMGKWLLVSFSVGQVLLIRSLGAFLVLGPMLLRGGTGDLMRPARPKLQLLRVALATGDTGLFYAAVIYLPLADVLTFYMAGPIYVAAFAHVFMGEKVGWRRWTAIFLGFVGVVIALRPSSASLTLPSLFGLLGSLCFAGTILLARVLRGTSDTTLVTWQTMGAMATGAVMSLGAWQTPNLFDLGALLLLGVVSCGAHLLITRSLKLAPASTLAPLQYTLLLWGIVFGIVFFGDVPDAMILTGSAIIVVAGLFIFHRQAVTETPPLPQGGARGDVV